MTPSSPAFYAHPTSAAESDRLRGMAAAADRLSLAALGTVLDRSGLVVADVGAGDSTSLGAALTARRPALRYLPVDIRPGAVDAHRSQGFEGRVGSATDLPIADRTVDVFHARFVFGWLDHADRRRAIEELLRVSAGSARVVIIDYDWSTAAGPAAIVFLKEQILRLLSAFGFDPYYGQRLATDMGGHLLEVGLDPAAFSLTEVRSTETEPMDEARGPVAAMVASIVDRLEALGLDDAADELRRLHDRCDDEGRRRPDAPVTFPTMVAVTVDLSDDAAVTAALSAIARRRTVPRRAGPGTGLALAGPPELGVYRLESDHLIDQARRLHAGEYTRHGHCTDDATDADGFLIAAIDPPDVIARSTYLGVLDDDGLVAGCIRIIRASDGDAMTLPTLAKLLAARPGGAAVAGLPFGAGVTVTEASGLARSNRNQDRALTTKLLLAVFCEAHRSAVDYVVMGVVPTTVKLLFALFGPDAIRPLDGMIGTVALAGTGIRDDGLNLIPCFSQTTTFLEECLQHCRARPERELTRLVQPLVELTAAAAANPRRDAESRRGHRDDDEVADVEAEPRSLLG